MKAIQENIKNMFIKEQLHFFKNYTKSDAQFQPQITYLYSF